MLKKRRSLEQELNDLRSEIKLLAEKHWALDDKVMSIFSRLDGWVEETNAAIQNGYKKLEKIAEERHDRLHKKYIDGHAEFSKANIAHHKLIEGWLKELRDFIIGARSR